MAADLVDDFETGGLGFLKANLCHLSLLFDRSKEQTQPRDAHNNPIGDDARSVRRDRSTISALERRLGWSNADEEKMTYGIYQATAGAVARRNQVDITAHNLANGDTPGYRSQEVTFEGVMRDVRAPQRHMVMTSGTVLDTQPGRPLPTGRASDFALRQRGFVRAEESGGRAVLLRTASLGISEDGLLVDDRGRTIIGEARLPIELDREFPFEIAEDGRVIQAGQLAGRLWFQQVPEEASMESLGGGAYAPTEASGDPFDVENSVMPGYVETSNVKPLESMVKLIDLERGFQATMKVIQAYREADDQLVERTSR